MKYASKNNAGLSRLQAVLISGVLLFLAIIVVSFLIFNVNLDKQNKESYNDAEDSQNFFELPQRDLAVLEVPNPETSNGDFISYLRLVKESAQKTEVLDITGCITEPPVVALKRNQPLQVINNDEIDHKITFHVYQEYIAKANATTTIEFDFEAIGGGLGEGVYPYGCEVPSGPAGIFVIID